MREMHAIQYFPHHFPPPPLSLGVLCAAEAGDRQLHSSGVGLFPVLTRAGSLRVMWYGVDCELAYSFDRQFRASHGALVEHLRCIADHWSRAL